MYECEVRLNFARAQTAMVASPCIDASLRISRMKLFDKWLRPTSQQDSVAEETQHEHSKESSLFWLGKDPVDSSIFDTAKRPTEKPAVSNQIPRQAPTLKVDSQCSTEVDTGYDPYNTGRFETDKA